MITPFNSFVLQFKKSYYKHGILFVMLMFLPSCGDHKPTPNIEKEIKVGNTALVSFTVIGDVPYNEGQREALIDIISKHNKKSDSSKFVIHVGDIKPGSGDCTETVYKEVSDLLKTFKTPTFIVLGDNEYNDCKAPEIGLAYWKKYFLHFNKNWAFEPTVSYQPERTENFSWVENNVLFIGINLVGSKVHDAMEWKNRLTENAEWVSLLLKQKNKVAAAVIFGHANMVEFEPEKFSTFTEPFRAAASAFKKPILMLQGDGHAWINDTPWPEKNITRLQIDGQGNAVKITVNSTLENPFTFDRNFLK